MPTPRVATDDALCGHPEPLERAIGLNGFDSIVTARRCVAAHWWRERRYKPLIELYGQNEQLLEYVGHAQFHGSVLWVTAVAILLSNSCILRSIVV